MSKFVVLLACVAVFQTASALQCYSCDGDACTKDMATWQKIPSCGQTVNAATTGACLKQVYTDKVTKKEVTSRKCVIADKQGDKISYKCNDINGVSSVCEVCNTDFCNSAPAVNFSFFALAAVLVAYLAPRFM